MSLGEMLRRGNRSDQSRVRSVTAAAAIGLLALTGCQVSKAKAHRTVDITVDSQGRAGFTPLTTTVQKGDFITIVVINRTNRIHGFAIRGYSVPPIEVGPDAPNNVVFTAKKEGTFQIYCQLHETHRTATLTVE